MKLTDIAYGKINLYLDVLNRRENGYHNIQSIMQSVTLGDTITLDIEDNSNDENVIEIFTSNDKIPNDKSNLVYKCAKSFFDKTEIKGKKCFFTIEKRIPISAGMAGGSSDGAIALKLLNSACGSILSYEELCSLGAKIGADIPFCLTGGTCLCEGIGDKIERITPFSNVRLVCAIDSSSVSTPVAFSYLDEKYGTNASPSADISKIISAINEGSIEKTSSLLYNKFENVILPINDNVNKIKSIMLSCGAIGALMSGSGPSVFGIFLDDFSQNNAYKKLLNCSINAFLCKTL